MPKIVVDNLFRLISWYAQALRETKGGNSVHDAEICSLRDTALLRGDFVDRDAENLRGCHGMDVLPGPESLNEVGVAAQMGHDAKFNL